MEEEERKRIDLEEAKYQAEKRKEAIEKAKAQQYYQTDRVKGFHVRFYCNSQEAQIKCYSHYCVPTLFLLFCCKLI